MRDRLHTPGTDQPIRQRGATWRASTPSARRASSASATRATRSTGSTPCDGHDRLPYSLKILLENLLRTEDGAEHHRRPHPGPGRLGPDGRARAWRSSSPRPGCSCRTSPACRAWSTWPPCGRRSATSAATRRKVNPLAPAELVIDHSVIADIFGRPDAFERNVEFEYGRNKERYQFLRWGQTAFNEFKVVPPGTGIVHQVNIEHLARVVMARATACAYPDTVVGTDSHTTMVNGLGVLGWGVGGIEAEAAMLGQPVSMLIPRVVGFKLNGQLPDGTTATDLVLTITQMLRKHGVVGKFVEFYGSGVAAVPLANRATIGNMSPEFGSTCAIFPIDEETIRYLTAHRPPGRAGRAGRGVRQGAGPVARPEPPEPAYSEYLELDLSTVVPSIAGPKRPQDRVALSDAKTAFRSVLPDYVDDDGVDEESEESFPASDPPASQLARPTAGPHKPTPVTTADGHVVRARPRRRRDRLDHLLHQHLQPAGDDRRRPAGPQGGRARA